MSSTTEDINAIASQEYKYGFVTDIEADTVPRGLNEDVIRLISAKKNEPDFMLAVAPEVLPPLADHEGAHLGECPLSADRLSGDQLLFGAQAQVASPRASTRSIRSFWKPMKSSAFP